MPLYSYTNGKKTVDIYQSMTEPHVYFDETGKEWARVWYNPQAVIDSQINPLDSRDFVNKTANKKETLGDIFDRSKEASLKREQIVGKDTVKESWEKNWSKVRGGRQLPKYNKDSVIEI